MTDLPSTAEEQSGAPATPRPAEGTNPLRLVVLLLVFGVALAGLLYDYTIARPNIHKADQVIQGLLDGTLKDPNNDGTVTAGEVQLMIGDTPSRVQQLSGGMIEIYSWRSGLPFRTYDLYVVYSGRRMPLLHAATVNTEPQGDQLPGGTIVPVEIGTGQIDNPPPPPVAGVGGPGDGAAGEKETQAVNRAPGVDAAEEPAKEQPPATEPAPSEPAPEPPAGKPPTQEEPAQETNGAGQV